MPCHSLCLSKRQHEDSRSHIQLYSSHTSSTLGSPASSEFDVKHSQPSTYLKSPGKGIRLNFETGNSRNRDMISSQQQACIMSRVPQSRIWEFRECTRKVVNIVLQDDTF